MNRKNLIRQNEQFYLKSFSFVALCFNVKIMNKNRHFLIKQYRMFGCVKYCLAAPF